MVINALNSGARCFMADLEDSNAPTWSNMVGGQVNLADAVRRTIELTGPDGREYRLVDRPATLLVRPRGWHLPERHLLVDGSPVSGSLFDFGLAFVHNAREQLERGTGRTSTCRSSRATSRPVCGTTSSCGRRTGSGSRAARSARPS